MAKSTQCTEEELNHLISTIASSKKDMDPALADELLSSCNATLQAQGLMDASSGFGLFNFSLAEVCSILKEQQQDNSHMSETAELIFMVVYGVLIITGLATNLAVIFAVARSSKIQTPRNLYIVNLTVSDISLCLVCMPFTLISLISKQWTMGETLCKLVPTLQGANIMVSTTTISTIAIDRYINIVRHTPLNAGAVIDRSQRRRIILSLAFVWLLSLASVLPLVFYQKVEDFAVDSLVLYKMCIEEWPSIPLKRAYLVYILLMMYFIPIVVLSVVHTSIAKFLQNHATAQNVAFEGSSQSDAAQIVASGRVSREMARNRKTTTILVVIAALFAISWLPHYILSIIVEVKPLIFPTEKLYIATAICHTIAMSTAITNPIVYGWMNTNIRRELIGMLPSALIQCCCKKLSADRLPHERIYFPSVFVDTRKSGFLLTPVEAKEWHGPDGAEWSGLAAEQLESFRGKHFRD
ncbi:neuropeptide Y receptor type 5-like isoform X2 [Neocloeon triangulifer]|uniref:neuropeptide Y receptor type 5-like isoform X2 n=1 Tax=Neocloeon triangulifer TaxID=2078957 RepID=UPI00286F5B6D|nr:neuropeptide Y receptor type 5-like isoform X2 [Neocloeon triangulifer]